MLACLLAVALAAPNIVFISVDTLRPDHLGFYGHPVATSPNLDRLAADSLVFDDMICEVPLTAPSFSAMMTSQYPRSTGVTRNGIPLPKSVPTVAEMFSTAGYETMCVTSNWTLKAKLSGLGRGFARYEDSFRKKRWVVVSDERDAARVTDIALKMLKNRDTSRPLFAWFHYSDPHGPYRLRSDFRVSDEDAYPGDPGASDKVRYDSEIAYTDYEIERVLRALPTKDTYIVFAADHGESLHEHDYVGHGRRVYQSGLRIPFFVYGPGIAAGRSNVPARGVDVGPTMLALAGIEPSPDMRGLALTRNPPADDRMRVVETYGGAVLHLPGARDRMTKAGPEWQCSIRRGWKLIRGGDAVELYYLPDDPMEMHNLAGEAADRRAALESSIAEWTKGLAPRTSTEAHLSAEDAEALRSLGYAK